MEPPEDVAQANISKEKKHDSAGDFEGPGTRTVFKILKTLTKDKEHNLILRENALLRQEMEKVRIELSEQRMENLRIKSEMADMEKSLTSTGDKEVTNLKDFVIETIQDFLNSHDRKLIDKFHLFESIFSCFLNDSNFMEKMRNFDVKFSEVLSKRFQFLFQNQMLMMNHKIHEVEQQRRQKLFQQFRTGMQMENWAQRLELQLSSLKLISELRGVILQLSTKKDRRKLLQALQNLENSLEKNGETSLLPS